MTSIPLNPFRKRFKLDTSNTIEFCTCLQKINSFKFWILVWPLLNSYSKKDEWFRRKFTKWIIKDKQYDKKMSKIIECDKIKIN